MFIFEKVWNRLLTLCQKSVLHNQYLIDYNVNSSSGVFLLQRGFCTRFFHRVGVVSTVTDPQHGAELKPPLSSEASVHHQETSRITRWATNRQHFSGESSAASFLPENSHISSSSSALFLGCAAACSAQMFHFLVFITKTHNSDCLICFPAVCRSLEDFKRFEASVRTTGSAEVFVWGCNTVTT